MDYIPIAFNSVEDECRFWKKLAQKYYNDWSAVKQDFDEYVQDSSQIEMEMDAELNLNQNTIKSLINKVALLKNECQHLRFVFESRITDFSNLEKQLESLKKDREAMKENLRSLEQQNDNLERIQRRLNQNILDTDKLLEKSFETIALLETEVNEKIVLEEKLENLKEEMEMMKKEIDILSRQETDGGNAVLQLSEKNKDNTNQKEKF